MTSDVTKSVKNGMPLPSPIFWAARSSKTLDTIFFCGPAAQCGPGPPHSWGFLITHNDASQSIGLLWTSDQFVAETSTRQHTTLTTNIHAPGGIRTHVLSRRTAVELRLRPRGHWDQRWLPSIPINYVINQRAPINYSCVIIFDLSVSIWILPLGGKASKS